MKLAVSFFGKCATEVRSFHRWAPFFDAVREEEVDLFPIRAKQADSFISLDHSHHCLKAAARSIPLEKRVLVIREGRSVRPDQYRRSVLKKYGSIFIPTHKLNLGRCCFIYEDGFLPRDPGSSSDVVRQPGSVCIVNTNKFSLHPESNYSLRQRLIVELTASGIGVALAGSRWNATTATYGFLQLKELLFAIRHFSPIDLRNLRRPIPRKARTHVQFEGFVTNSVQFMKKHVFVLIVENDSFCITEKFFDAVSAGCIPIYYGPNLDTYGVPQDIYIKIENPDQVAELVSRLKSITVEDQTNLRLRANEWLLKPETFARWSETIAMKHLWESIFLRLETNRTTIN